VSAEPSVLQHRDSDQLAAALAARLVTVLIDAQAEGRVPSVVLTGGSVARAVHRAVRDSPARDEVDWSTAGRMAQEQVDPQADIHASADYRRHLVGVLTERALRAAAERAV